MAGKLQKDLYICKASLIEHVAPERAFRHKFNREDRGSKRPQNVRGPGLDQPEPSLALVRTEWKHKEHVCFCNPKTHPIGIQVCACCTSNSIRETAARAERCRVIDMKNYLNDLLNLFPQKFNDAALEGK
ncbi:hypothetical protein CBL_11046 [Carabus blaptoides fortunei]